MDTAASVDRPSFHTPSFCSECGLPVKPRSATLTSWICPQGHKSYCNPRLVGLGMMPVVGGGVVLIRRNTNPGFGLLDIPGGFIESGESLEQGIGREFNEEVMVPTQPALWGRFYDTSSPNRQQFHVFRLYQVPLDSSELPVITNDEVTEIIVATSVPPDMAFDTHRDALRLYFGEA